MAKVEWGTKRTCHGCMSSFYDMKKSPATCPKCLTVYDTSALKKPLEMDKPAAALDNDHGFDTPLSADEQKLLSEAPKDLMENLEELDGVSDPSNYLK